MAGTKPDRGAQSLAEAAAAWLPTSDPVAAARILAILQQIAINPQRSRQLTRLCSSELTH